MPFIEYSDPATTSAPGAGRGMAGWFDSIFGAALPERLDPQTRQDRAAAIMDVQNMAGLLPGYESALDAIEKARGPAAAIEGRRIYNQMRVSLAAACAPINDGIRAAIAAGKLTDTGQLRAFPVAGLIVVLIVAAALLVAEWISLKQWPGIMAAREDARQRSAAFQAWLSAYNAAAAAGQPAPPSPIALPGPSEPAPWGSFGLAAVLIGAGLLLIGWKK